MIPQILAKLDTDPAFTDTNAAQEFTDIFSNLSEMSKNGEYLRSVYEYLRARPRLSRALFDEMIARHNAACLPAFSGSMIPGCCCCGIDPYNPSEQLSIDVEQLESAASVATKAASSSVSSDFVALVSAYRRDAHANTGSIAIMKASKHSVGIEFFNRLASQTAIEKEEAEYIYAVLQHNECIGEDLFEYAFSGARLSATLARNPVDDSPVVASIRDAFNSGDASVAGREGGGCCCCCCCCCCGGGC